MEYKRNGVSGLFSLSRLFVLSITVEAQMPVIIVTVVLTVVVLTLILIYYRSDHRTLLNTNTLATCRPTC